MKNTTKLFILLIVLSIKSNGQTNISKYTFKNSIVHQDGKKIYSYKPNGEIILFNPRSDKNEIETKMVVTTLEGNPLKIDTLNLDSLNLRIGEIIQGIGQYEKWILKSSTTFHQNGKINKNIVYSNVGKTGLFTSYDNTGKIIEKGSYINNKLKDGEWLKYDENGKVVRKENYKDGIRIESTQ
jgi:antitoxin component YwqK of YwqJK toxin-antitoxin module